MSRRPDQRKKQEQYNQEVQEHEGGLFGDLGDTGPDLSTDKIVSLRKDSLHFRLMVATDKFPFLKPGSELVYSKGSEYPTGIVQPDGRIYIQHPINRTVDSTSSFAKMVSGYKNAPDGWNRVWVVQDNGALYRLEDLFFKHHDLLGYTVDELSRLDYIYSRMRSDGHQRMLGGIDDPAKKKQRPSTKKKTANSSKKEVKK